MSRVEKLKQKNNPNRIVNQRTKEEKEPAVRGKLYILFIIILLSSLLYLIFFSGIFNIEEVVVSGYQNPGKIEEVVEEVSEDSLFKNNILFLNKEYVAEIIEGDPRIKSIYIKKIMPNKIEIKIEESKPEMIWVSAGDNFLVDGGGYVIEKTEDNNYVSVYDGSNITVSLGERVASPTFIKFIKDINENLEPITGAKIKRITIFDIMSDVHVLSSNNWTVYLDATKDAESQLENLNRVLAEARGAGKSLEYIDMRLDNRIYYK